MWNKSSNLYASKSERTHPLLE